MIRLSTCILLTTALLSTGCDIGEEKSEDQQSPVPNRWQVPPRKSLSDLTDANGNLKVAGSWIAAGEFPAFMVSMIPDDEPLSFTFDTRYDGDSIYHLGDGIAWWRAFRKGDSSTGTIEGTSLTYRHTGFLFERIAFSNVSLNGESQLAGSLRYDDVLINGREEERTMKWIFFEDAKSAAPALSIDNSAQAQLGPQKTYALYTVVINSLQSVQLRTPLSSNQKDTWLFLLDEDGTIVAQNDDALGSNSLINVSYVSALLFPGTYYVMATVHEAGGGQVNLLLETLNTDS